MRKETARREIESLDYYLQNHTNDYSEKSHTAMKMAIEALEKEPREGEWIDVGGVIRYGCQFCHHAQEEKSHFCPNCGAKMDKEEEE